MITKLSNSLSLMVISALLTMTSHFGNAQQIPNKIRILNYNVKGTPSFPSGGNSKKTLKKIRDAIISKIKDGTAPDVILFQEVFSSDAKDVIRSLNSNGYYPYMVLGPGADGNFSYSSGLTTLSKIPIIYNEAISYGSENCATWDCYANKGAHLAVLKANNWSEPIVVVNTHLQAENEFDLVRQNQMQILRKFVSTQTSKGLSVIIGGDLNTKPNRPSYNYFKNLFNEFVSVGEFCLGSLSGCEVNRATSRDLLVENTKDHQFYSNSRKLGLTPVGFVRNFSKEVDGFEYSDHKGYQVDYKLDWR